MSAQNQSVKLQHQDGDGTNPWSPATCLLSHISLEVTFLAEVNANRSVHQVFRGDPEVIAWYGCDNNVAFWNELGEWRGDCLNTGSLGSSML